VGPTELNDVSSRCHFQKAPPPSKKTTCPLCAEEIQETKLFLRRHIGHHLEEIALAALPPDIYQLGDEVGSNSTDSLAPQVNVMENSGAESLVLSTHAVENRSAAPSPPLVLYYEQTGQEALPERIDYLGIITDGTSGGGGGDADIYSADRPPPLTLSFDDKPSKKPKPPLRKHVCRVPNESCEDQRFDTLDELL
jgi:hypothetical protein